MIQNVNTILLTCRQFGDGSVEKLVSAVEGLEELGLLLVDDVLDRLGVLAHLGEKVSKKFNNGVNLNCINEFLFENVSRFYEAMKTNK
jgi:hypothetical protein